MFRIFEIELCGDSGKIPKKGFPIFWNALFRYKGFKIDYFLKAAAPLMIPSTTAGS